MATKKRRRSQSGASPVIGRRGTYRVTVPKTIVSALDLEGALFIWNVINRDTLEVKVDRSWRETRTVGEKE